MLFDIRGKRKRLIQVTYVTLAVLFGASLVLFGTGSGVSGAQPAANRKTKCRRRCVAA